MNTVDQNISVHIVGGLKLILKHNGYRSVKTDPEKYMLKLMGCH